MESILSFPDFMFLSFPAKSTEEAETRLFRMNYIDV
jgi:hypothetical protein